MQILEVRPKGMYVTVEFSIEQLERLRDFLSCSKAVYNSKDSPKMNNAAQYITEVLYPALDEFIDNAEKEKWL
jgi:hypothetical protein